MDCETAVENQTIRQCFLDIKHILNNNSIIVKPVSEFGTVLCTKYKRKSRFRLRSQTVYSKFNFGTPSPDDVVAKHLRR